MVNSYLRLRLEKIQSNIFHYTKTDDDNPSRLTQEEADFALNYKENLTEHFNSLALRHIPGVWESTKVVPTAPAPNLSTAVFVSVREDVPRVDIQDEAISDIKLYNGESENARLHSERFSFNPR